MDDLIADFLTETRVDLDRVRDALTRVGAGAPLGDEVIEMTRGIRSVRTGAGAIGMCRVADLANSMEGSLERLRQGAPATPDILRNITRALDRIGRLVAILAATGAEPSGGDPDLIAALSEDGEARHRMNRLAAQVAPEGLADTSSDDPWAAIERAVSQTAAQMRKHITLTIDESARTLPALIVRAVQGPLALVVRHACVYSIELEVIRLARGKRGGGTIRITALRVDAQAAIAIADDGAGLDLERLRRRAVTLGRVRKGDAATYSDAALAQLVFAPGVSNFGENDPRTGLDVAKAELERVGGAIEVNSAPGRGATFLIRAPLASALAPAPTLTGALA